VTSADKTRLDRMARAYEALRPTDIPVDRSRFEPSLTDFTRSGWAYFPVKDVNQLALAINRALGEVRLPAMPEVASIQSIGFCNLRCPHCPTHGTDEAHAVFQSKAWTMADDMIRRIAEESFPYARQVSMSGAGENLLARNNEIAAELAHVYGCNVFINSNGTVISKRRMRPLWGATHLRVSRDGATPATFEALRRGADFAKVMRNVRIMTRASELLPRSLRLQTAINFGICASNLRDLPLMVDLARFLGIGQIYGFAVSMAKP
jgi:MoaA/NifB/PqqE/SkfB family radical SAM enzyme